MRCFFGSDKFIRLGGLDLHGNSSRTPTPRSSPATSPQDSSATPRCRPTALLHRDLPHQRRAQVQGRHPLLGSTWDLLHRRRGCRTGGAPYAPAYGDAVFFADGSTCSCGGPPRSWPRVPTRPRTSAPRCSPLPLSTMRGTWTTSHPGLRRHCRRRPGADVLPQRGADRLFTHSPPDDPATEVVEPDVIRELWIASVTNPDDRRRAAVRRSPHLLLHPRLVPALICPAGHGLAVTVAPSSARERCQAHRCAGYSALLRHAVGVESRRGRSGRREGRHRGAWRRPSRR